MDASTAFWTDCLINQAHCWCITAPIGHWHKLWTYDATFIFYRFFVRNLKQIFECLIQIIVLNLLLRLFHHIILASINLAKLIWIYTIVACIDLSRPGLDWFRQSFQRCMVKLRYVLFSPILIILRDTFSDKKWPNLEHFCLLLAKWSAI